MNLNNQIKKSKIMKTVNPAISSVKPNLKLQETTGFPFLMFYISTQVVNTPVDFENPGHIKLINLLNDQEKSIKQKGELSPSEIQAGRRLFKKVLNKSVSYSKYDGADCSFRLVNDPAAEWPYGKCEWFNSPYSAIVEII
jgi:hypothetical protein